MFCDRQDIRPISQSGKLRQQGVGFGQVALSLCPLLWDLAEVAVWATQNLAPRGPFLITRFWGLNTCGVQCGCRCCCSVQKSSR